MADIETLFYNEMLRSEEQIRLAYAGLLFESYIYHPLDIRTALQQVNHIAQTANSQVSQAPNRLAAVEALNHYFFTELGFRGNESDYYENQNSFLSHVLTTRLGIPISLSVIYLEVGWQLGIPLFGVNLPRHFVVACEQGGAPFYIDVFAGGTILNEDDCWLLSQVTATEWQFHKDEYLARATKKQILYRQLLNLKHIYMAMESFAKAQRTIDLMVMVRPGVAEQYRDRGLIAYSRGQLHQAIFDIQRYLFLTPKDSSTDWLRDRVDTIERKLLRLN